MVLNPPQMQLVLPPRWSALRYQPEQSRLWHDPRRFKLVHAGRRSGKTEIAKRRIMLAAVDVRYHPRPWADSRFFFAAPTRQQCKRIYWDDVKRLAHPSWVRRAYESDLCLVTNWGAEVWCVGLDNPARIEGSPWDGGIVDEYPNCRAGIFDAHIRPMLADRQGFLWFVGVPDFAGPAQGEYAELVRVARSGVDPEWGAYTWPTWEIVDAEEVESARRRMDPRLFLQEFGGEFVAAGGRAFPDFLMEDAPAGNLTGVARYNPALPLWWSLDFNVGVNAPMCSLVGQEQDGKTIVLRELELPDTRTGVVCEAFLEMAAREAWDLRGLAVYGDASGAARKTTGPSDWTVVRQWLRDVRDLRWMVRRANPPIRDTVNAVNARVLNAARERRLLIHRECRRIARDLESAIWPSTLDEHHSLAALRYYVQTAYPIREAQTDDDGRVVFTEQ